MEHPVISKKLMTITLILFVLAVVLGGGTSLLAADEGRIVEVTFKDGQRVIRFNADSFRINWVDAQIKAEGSCAITSFAIEEVAKIYIQTEGVNGCDQIDNDWIFEVFFKDPDRISIQGFIPMNSKDVTGIIYGTTEERTIGIDQIGLIRFE